MNDSICGESSRPSSANAERRVHVLPEHLASSFRSSNSTPQAQVATESTFITTSQSTQSSQYRHNGAQATHSRHHWRPPTHNLHTRAALEVNRERCTRYLAGHIQQIRAKDTAAREVAGHIYDFPAGCRRVAILLRGACWKLCTYTSIPHHSPRRDATETCRPVCAQLDEAAYLALRIIETIVHFGAFGLITP
jgi:hypothetical protein